MATRQTPTNPKKPLVIITTRTLSWLDHAERHYKDGAITETIIHSPDEALMYLCLFSYVGMFD
jgi:hypothetical protein